jgi:hypothetical protein
MNRLVYRRANKWLTGLLAMAIVLMPLAAFAQTKIVYHSNKYKPTDDVKLGRQAAAEAEQQFPLLRDSQVTSYVERIGQRLVASIPPEFQHPEFRYYFKVINARDINAFALPGGPMYVNRGMIEAARTEGEMAGVMAHELSHVALRHGTAQATKAGKYQLGAGIAGVLGTILGGPGLGQVAQVPFAAAFLKYSREYETEADILGARIMADAGYDPRDLANMFRTIEQQGGGGGGGFLSDHPSPANRYARINQEAQYLRVNNPVRDTREFLAVKERLRSYPRAASMAEIAQNGRRYPNQGNDYPNGERTDYPSAPRGRVEYPSSRYRTYTALGVTRVSVPDNWRELSEGGSVWFAPNGGYGSSNGQAVFTHGVNIGINQANSRNLQQATNEFLNSLQQGNGNMRARSGYQRAYVGGRNGLSISLSNTNEATGRPEIVNVFTTQLRNGELLYIIMVAPESDYNNYQATFQNILRSLQLVD